MADDRQAVVVGAGIAGLSTAIALAQAGWRVTVLERAMLVEELGAGIQIPPNAARILQNWGIVGALMGRVMAPEALRLRRGRDGRDILRMPLGALAELRWGAPYLVAHRGDLIAALLQRAAREPGIRVETGANVVGFARSESGVQVAVRQAAAANRCDGEVLIGADGLRSSIRNGLGLGLADEPIWSGRTAWRALIEGSRAPPHALRLETCLWLGRRAHLVHYPLRGGDLVNVVAVVEDGWRGQEGDIWSARGDFSALEPFFARWSHEVRALVEAARDWRRWPLFDRNLASRWTDGRVALAGDAAHPMAPFLAQGAAQALEDAQALGRRLAEPCASVVDALAAYQSERMARAAAVQLASRRQGEIYHLGAAAALARDAALKTMGFDGLMRRLDWLYRGG